MGTTKWIWTVVLVVCVLAVPAQALKPLHFGKTPDEIKELEEKIISYARENNLKTERGDLNRLIIKDAEGNEVPLPPAFPGDEPESQPFSPEELEIVEAAEKEIKAYAKTKGYSVASDPQDRISLQDAAGKRVSYPAEMVPLFRVYDHRIRNFAKQNGFTVDRGKDGRLSVKDPSGAIVPIPPELLPPGDTPTHSGE